MGKKRTKKKGGNSKPKKLKVSFTIKGSYDLKKEELIIPRINEETILRILKIKNKSKWDG